MKFASVKKNERINKLSYYVEHTAITDLIKNNISKTEDIEIESINTAITRSGNGVVINLTVKLFDKNVKVADWIKTTEKEIDLSIKTLINRGADNVFISVRGA